MPGYAQSVMEYLEEVPSSIGRRQAEHFFTQLIAGFEGRTIENQQGIVGAFQNRLGHRNLGCRPAKLIQTC